MRRALRGLWLFGVFLQRASREVLRRRRRRRPRRPPRRRHAAHPLLPGSPPRPAPHVVLHTPPSALHRPAVTQPSATAHSHSIRFARIAPPPSRALRTITHPVFAAASTPQVAGHRVPAFPAQEKAQARLLGQKENRQWAENLAAPASKGQDLLIPLATVWEITRMSRLFFCLAITHSSQVRDWLPHSPS